MNDKTFERIVILIAVVYVGLAFWLVKDYGITIDEPQHFAVGEKYFNFYRSGHLNFSDDTPQIENHPDFHNRQLELSPFIMPPFANILSAFSCYVFFQKLNVLEPFSAHHIVIPILVGIFINILYCFVKKHWDGFSGLISVLAFLTYPRFFGHSFNNIKDIPQIIFFSITIILFAEWITSRKTKFLYMAFLCWGLALATKMDAVLIPVILLLWQLPVIYKCFTEKGFFQLKIVQHLAVGFIIALVVVICSYPPLLTSQGSGRKEFIAGIIKYVHSIGTNPDISWNLYAPSQILYVTPVLMLLFFTIGFAVVTKKARSDNLLLLLIIWLVFPVIRHCLPKANHYDGLRHFFVFIVPFAIILSFGVVYLAEKTIRHIKIPKEWLLIFFVLLFLTSNVYSIVTLHPFQTTYYNLLVGGLKGAQEKEIPYANDYWLNSYRMGWRWLKNNAKKGARYYAYPDGYLFNFHRQRSDLKPTRVGKMSFPGKKYLTIPRNTYVIVVPRKLMRMNKLMHMNEILSVVDQFKLVYQIKRQKGEILTIYYIDESVGQSIGGNKNVAVFHLPS